MFILLKSGAMLNLFWLQDCFQGKHDKNIVIFYMVNGTKIIEEYDTESEASSRVSEVHNNMDKAGKGGLPTEIVDELPTEDIQENIIYLVKAPDGDETNMFIEYVYIDGEWEEWGRKQIDLTPIYNKLDEQEQEINNLKDEIDKIYEMLKWKEY